MGLAVDGTGELSFRVMNDGSVPMFVFAVPGHGGVLKNCAVVLTDDADWIVKLYSGDYAPRFIKLAPHDSLTFQQRIEWHWDHFAGCKDPLVTLTVAGFLNDPTEQIAAISEGELRPYLRANQLLFMAGRYPD